MNISKTIKYTIIGALLAITVSCDDYLDVNQDPNRPLTPSIDGLLANTTYQTAFNHQRLAATTSFYAQYLASPNQGSDTDTYGEISLNGTWQNLYGTLTDLYDMSNQGTERGAFQHAAVAKILSAANLGMVVDTWGQAAFTEAFTGETFTPGYNTGEELYAEIFNLLDEGLADLANPENQIELNAASDLIHGGDSLAWARTAHSLKARYLNHLSKQSNYDPAAVLAEVSQGYQTIADNSALGLFEERNPWARVAIRNAGLILGGWLSEQVIDAMNGTTFGVFDPRLPFFTDTIPGGTFVGTPNGAGRRGDGTVQEECYLTTNGYYSSEDAPLEIMTFAELKFIEAEAAFNSDKPRSLNAFLDGIRAHMSNVGVAQEDIDTYLANAYPDISAASITLEIIMREKYVAMFLHPEAWVDARRFDYQYQDFTLPVGAALSEFIRRIPYPDNEVARNGVNVPEVSLTDRIFWDR